MNTHPTSRQRGFTLLETVIAIGVLAVLLTGFMIVFTPAAQGIRKSINVQQAERLATTLEQQLSTLRSEPSNSTVTGFEKAFDRISQSSAANNALVVYQYRGKINDLRPDFTPKPLSDADNKTRVPGEDFSVVSVMRQVGDAELTEDLPAVEGSIYLVKCTQLVFAGGQLVPGTPGQIKNADGVVAPTSATYTEAVVAFSAEFYMLPGKTAAYVKTVLPGKFSSLTKPVFSRNLAVRR